MKQKRRCVFLWVLCLLFLFSPKTVFGAEWEEGSYEEELWEVSGAEGLLDELPQEAQEILTENGMEELTSEAVLNLGTEGFLKILWEGMLKQLTQPIRIFASAVGVILLAALLGSFETTFEEKSLHKVFSVVAVLCISGILVTPVIEVIGDTVETMEQAGEFLLSFLPVYAGIISVSGKPISAFTYQSLLIGTVELFHFLSANLLVPLSGVYLALSLTGAASGQIEINGITKGIKQLLTWVLGLFLTIFVGILTVKSFVANSADTVSLRAGKYLVGSFLPMVGGAVSDALSVVQGSLSVMRSTVGAFGILAVLVIFLPGILRLLLMSLSLYIAKAVGEILRVEQIVKLLDAAGFVLSFIQSIFICYGLMVIISVSFMLMLGLGT